MWVTEVREWTMWLMEAGILFYVGLEYHYDKAKDEKKQRRTKTTKKTTSKVGGESVVEESTEVSEPVNGDKNVA